MKVYKFKNYDEYVASQKEANEEKQHMSFVQLKTIKKIFDVMDLMQKISCVMVPAVVQNKNTLNMYIPTQK